MQNRMMSRTSLEDLDINEVEEPGLRIDSLLEPIDSLLQEGQYAVAYRFLKVLRPVRSENPWVEERLRTLYRKWIPRWHFEMLNDADRGQAFADALDAIDLRDKTVLDIGTGSGLLAMLAVRRGARHVYACEMVEPLAETAMEIVQLNGLAHKITIIPKPSFEIEIGKDMPERADVMVSETIDCGFVGEGFLPTLQHAREHLLRSNAQLIPAAAELRGVLIESPKIHQMNHVGRSQGFDLSKMNEFSTRGYFKVRLESRPHAYISLVKTLVDLDLYDPVPEHITRVIEFEASQSGMVHGVAFWFNVTLAPGVVISNSPDQGESHWPQAFAGFPEPVALQKGDCFSVEVAFSRQAVQIAPLSRPRPRVAIVNGREIRQSVSGTV